MLLDIPIKEIVLDDLLELIDQRAPESLNLEFKRDPYGEYQNGILKLRKEHKREMLKDISGMANAEGGDLIIGIEENNWGQAVKLSPIIDPYEIKKSMLDICNQGIRDPIEGLQIHIVERVMGVDGFLIIRVPSSNLKPHMVSLHGYTSFFIRIDNIVQTMHG